MKSRKTKKPMPSESVQTKLPSIKQLIVESWQLLTKKALKLLFLGIFSLAINVGMLIVGGIAVFSAGAMNLSSFSDPQAFLKMTSSPGFISTAISVGVIWFIGMIAVATALQAAMLILLKDPKEETSVIEYFKKGCTHVLPLLVVGAITFILVLGSFFVFVIPALIIGIFMIFTTYTVVLDNKKGLDAIKMSVGIVNQNFGAIMGRIFLLWFLSFAVQMIIGMLPNEEASAAILYFLISMVSSFAISWFGLAYIFKLYEHAKAAYDDKKPTSMTWMWIVSILGWIIGAMIITGIISAVGNKDFQNTIQEAVQKEMEAEFNDEMDFENDLDYDKSPTL